MIQKKLLIVCLLMLGMSWNGQAQIKPTLTIGSEAPRLEVSQWLKGDPVKQFKAGHFYVVEFWATWCAPCIAAMPHLSDLAEKYKGKATFIGVSIKEGKRKSTADVAQFAKENSHNMRYTVAMDDPETNVVDAAWMSSAGLNAIPATFVVDGNGRIAWIGHPDALDPVLETLISQPDKFDRNTAKSQHDKDFYQQSTYQASRELSELLSQKNYGLAWQKVQTTVQNFPGFEQDYFAQYLVSYLNYDIKEALAYVDSRSNDATFLKARKTPANTDPRTDFLHEVARSIAVQDNLDPSVYLMAIPYLKQDLAGGYAENYNVWQMYARALSHIGEYKQAEKAQEQALHFFKQNNGHESNSMLANLAKPVLEKMERSLTEYRSLAVQKENAIK